MLACLFAGCRAPTPLPQYPWEGHEAALRTIRERAERIESISAGFRMTVRPPEQDRISVEGAMALRRPELVRVQAWKFDQEVLDVTHRPEGTWVWVTERAAGEREDMPRLDKQAGDWSMAVFGSPESDAVTVVKEKDAAGNLVLRYPLADTQGWSAELTIDRPTRTVREYRVLDEAEQVVQAVTLEDYRLINGIAFPMRITARGSWEMALRLHDVTLNEPLPDDVFEPPAHAAKQE